MPLGGEHPAQRLRRIAAVRVRLRGWGPGALRSPARDAEFAWLEAHGAAAP